MKPLVRIESISRCYSLPNRIGKSWALKDVSLNLPDGQATGLVGESGAGKSTLARLILGLERPDSGHIVFDGKNIAVKRRRLNLTRQIQIIWQDPMIYLNPYDTVAGLISEPMIGSGVTGRAVLQDCVVDLMHAVGLSPDLAERRPHELSGGQCQRVAIARAISVRPRLLICDEPLSSLDIPHQAQILKLLLDLQTQYGLTCLFISHDLTAVRKFCTQMAIIKDGRIVESGNTMHILHNPLHPYSRQLINTMTINAIGLK
jgi:ABC-type dipeptide/oligopeptide/nickel transport system ATPase subunit